MISLRSAYEQQGYILLKGVLPKELLDAHGERVARVYDRYGLQSEADIEALASSDGPSFGRFQEDVTSLHNDEQGLALTLHATLRGTVAEIIGADPIRVSGFTTRWGSEAEPGVDTSVVWRGPWQTVCRTWCAVEDVHMEAGPIYIYPGSHLSLGTVFRSRLVEEHPEVQDLVDELRSADNRSLFEGKLRDLNQAAALFLKERTASLTPVFFPISQGDVVLFSLEAVHGGAAIQDPQRTCMSLIMDWQSTQTEQYLAGARWPGEVPDKYADPLPKEPDLVSGLGKYRIPDRHAYDRLLARFC